MIVLPTGFDYTTFISDLLSGVTPFVPVLMVVAAGFLVIKIIGRG